MLVRHGRTAWNAEGRFLGERDLPLDEVGRASLSALAPLRGRFAAVYASPAARATETARALGGEPIGVPALAEMRQGELEGHRVAEAVSRWPAFFAAWEADPGVAVAPGGESLGQAHDRVWPALLAVRAAHPGAWIAVVGHQLAFASVLARLAGAPLRSWRDWRLGHLDAAVLRGDPLSLATVLRAGRSA